ncbi:hypothetical protein ACIP4U_24175 [Streptomyces caelestis]|uniref:Uncharacterized protein n=1 Tax=Streptomyces caelestis TaxID=36816 RepID=A0A7W9LQH4_9ACTN|nr:hypothetical protein [Streptomyces caelestis]MBB5792371.1 hypothetical protein [Streptomyces caelestis]GGW71673.1 hypothetical protein GCM10010320_61680 [Streptomyces caelestis]
MPTSSTVRPMTPATVWLARGRHAEGTAEDVLRRSLEERKRSRAIDDFLELPESGTEAAPAERVFEARWRVEETVTVRARIGVTPGPDGGQEWILVAEAEQPWNDHWPSPAGLFWPEEPDVAWDRDGVAGLSLRKVNPLPHDDKETRRLFRNAVRGGWHIHVVVHEAMTTDDRGRVPVARWLPVGLRHRVVEHRAAPQQHRGLNWALRDLGVQVPRGGAVVLPGKPVPDGYDAEDFSVRAVFLDGSEPTDLVDAVTRYAALPRPLPDGAEDALTALREDWHLLTLEEELERQRGLVAMYAEALEAMTKSRDLYRQAAERAHEALAAYQESAEAAPVRQQPSDTPVASPLQQLTRTFERLKGRPQRPVAPSRDER